MFGTFHMTNPAVFYNREDQWEIPSFDAGGTPAPMHPYYTIMKLPGETGPEYIQMLPFTPRGKDNLAAWMVARSDGENYGKLAVFQFPKQTVIFGPRQVAARINQDQVISPQITLWNQQGSEVIQGTLLVIPIEESLIYIRPLYLKAAGGQIPELKRVIVAYQNNIVMDETLSKALERIMPAGSGEAGTRGRGGAGSGRAGRVGAAGVSRGRVTGRTGARPLQPRAPGAARRQLGALRGGDQEARRGPGEDADSVSGGVTRRRVSREKGKGRRQN